MLDEFIRRLQEAGATGTAGRMALVLPSPYLLERARTFLRMTELPVWEFPRVLSLDELAANLSGLPKISRVEQELLIDGIVKETAGAGLFPYFDKILDFPGFIAALARLFDEFKMASVTPDELEMAVEALADEMERNLDRDAAIVGLFRAYQDRLVEYSLVDVGGMYRLAMETLEQQEKPLPFERIFMAEFSVLSPLRLQLIENLKRRVPMEIGICFEKNRPSVFRCVEPVYQALVGMNFAPEFHEGCADSTPALKHLRQELFGAQPLQSEAAAGMKILLSPSRSKELSVTADRIKALLLQGTYSPQEVAVVVNAPESYSRLRSVFDDRRVPVDKAGDMPVMERALPRLVFSWLDLLQERGSRASAMAVLKSPYVGDKLDWDGDLLEKCMLGEVLRSWDDWEPAMQRQAPDESSGEAWRQGWQELMTRAREWSEEVTWSQWAELLRELLVWFDAPATLGRRLGAGILSLQEVRAELQSLQLLMDVADQIEQFPNLLQQTGKEIRIGEFTDILRRMLQDAKVSLSDRQDTGVQVVTPETASGMNFRAVFLLGLAEGEFPAPPKESWLYSDRERRTLRETGIFLSTSEERAAAADFSFSLAAGMATEQLVFSVLTDSETLPSRFLAEVTRLYAKDAIEVETFGPHQVVAEKTDAVWSSRELLNATLHHVWQDAAHPPSWDAVYSALSGILPDGLEKKATIEDSRTGAYAGLIDPSLIQVSRFSPSALEQYAVCPFAYFVTEVLKLGQWDEAQEGFDALSSGSVWHEILASFLTRYRSKKLDPMAMDSYAQELVRLLENTVARRELQGKIVPDVWWQFEKPRWEKALRSWLSGELERQADTDRVPSFFEWAFGAERLSGCDAESTELPLTIEGNDKEETMELQGKVDRIDEGGGAYRIIDYKTGKAPARKQIEQGLRLQIPVYMMAVEELMYKNQKITGDGVYLPVGVAAPELKLPGAKMTQEELFAATKQYVTGYVAGIRSGKFPAQPTGTCPSYCMGRTFCRLQAEPDGEGTEDTTDE